MAQTNSSTTSAYKTFKTAKNVEGLGLYVDARLFQLIHAASDDAGMSRDGWVRQALTKAVNDAGYEYTYPTPANLKTENAALAAKLAQMEKELAAAKAALVPPTPPAVKADAKTGIVS